MGSGGGVQGLLGNVPMVVVVIAGVCAPLAGWMAMQRSRNPIIWFGYGALTGPIAVFLLFAAPPGRCPDCEQPVQGWAWTCAACGARFTNPAARLAQAQRSAPPPRPLAVPEPVRTTPAIAPNGVPTTHPSSGATAPIATAPTVLPAQIATAPTAPIAPVPLVDPGRIRPATSSSVTTRSGAARRRSFGASRTAASIEPPVEDILATGLYLSGNAGLEIGGLYAIARVDDRIRILGPVYAGQLSLRLERSLAETVVHAVEDQINLSVGSGRSATSIVMRAVGGKRAGELEAALAPVSGAGSSAAQAGR